ncbi:MAG TPA: alpha-galactosidase [Armatimonadota bacterium]|jgi:alpha-galactosidase
MYPGLVLVLLLLAAPAAWSLSPNAEEIRSAKQYLAPVISSEAERLPFSFTYGGRPSAELLPRWKRKQTKRSSGGRTLHKVTWTDAGTGLELRCEAVEYRDFPTVEWTLYFRNTGAADTPILEGIQALDTTIQRGSGEEFLLHHNVGSPNSQRDYAPLETPLGPGAVKKVSAAGGRPTNTDLSYFNFAWGNQGLILAVGWPGQWASEFARDKGTGLHLRAGQELTHFTLHPGEEVRTPLIALQTWQGDWLRGQNLWRRWMMAYSMPKPGGRLPKPMMLASSSRAYQEMIGADEASQIMHIDRYLAEGFKLDYWWMDAGWYPQQHGWPQVGTWEPDPKRFPRGLKPISDHAHSRGVKTLLWFEPERVAEDTWLSNNHPEWILGGKKGGLLNLGNPDAWKWLVEHIDGVLTQNGIDLYRQDFNMDPLDLWRKNDAPDRQGITENKHVVGYLAYWDELRRRHPKMLIDSCASGGRRNDLETMRRAVPLWRSDYAYEPLGHQGMTYGLSMWLPYHGTGTVASTKASYYGGGISPVEPYAFWSNAAPSLGCGVDIREKGLDYATLRKLYSEWRKTSPLYYGDYYPLTPCSYAEDAWMAWQFNRPEKGDGMVQAFCHANCAGDTLTVTLRDLDPEAAYTVQQVDGTPVVRAAGRLLMETGLAVRIPDKPGAAVLTYRRSATP